MQRPNEFITASHNNVIPRYEPCEKGRGGGPCGSCKLKAKQAVEHNTGLTFEEAIARRWHPKTINAAREVPFDWDPRVELVIERFLQDDRYDGWPLSANAVNRRVKKAAGLADEIDADRVYPHALRATAASHHSDRGIDVYALKALMGWSDLSTAQHYISSSGERTARSLHQVHSR